MTVAIPWANTAMKNTAPDKRPKANINLELETRLPQSALDEEVDLPEASHAHDSVKRIIRSATIVTR